MKDTARDIGILRSISLQVEKSDSSAFQENK